MDKVNLTEKFAQFEEVFSHRIVGEINDMYVKLVKINREFIWHSHEWEDEMFFVAQGQLTMLFRGYSVKVVESEFIIVPHGVEHKPEALQETHFMLIDPKETVNTGGEESELKHDPKWIQKSVKNILSTPKI